VRSVMVLPLADAAGVLGVFEALSPRASAFGERDQRTLEILGRRVLRNVERAANPLLLRSVTPPRSSPEPASPKPERASSDSYLFAAPTFGMTPESAEFTSRPRLDLVTALLAMILLAGMLFMGALTARRMGWNVPLLNTLPVKGSRTAAVEQNIKQNNVEQNNVEHDNVEQNKNPPVLAAQAIPSPASLVDTHSNASSGVAVAPASSAGQMSSPTLSGGLRVFEDGKEVFRLPASGPVRDRPASAGPSISAAGESSIVHRVEPEYPEQARLNQLQGKVVLDVRIYPDGTVKEAELMQGEPLLAEAAIKAVRQWRFKPRADSRDGSEIHRQITLNFRLPN
ncbi:MAG TPA: TonB family protein, partial [Candidatus Sulfotelmatobacter sp.]